MKVKWKVVLLYELGKARMEVRNKDKERMRKVLSSEQIEVDKKWTYLPRSP